MPTNLGEDTLHKHTSDTFNRQSVAITILLWLLFFGILCVKGYPNLLVLPTVVKVILAIPIPLTGLIKYLNDYHYRKEDRLLKGSVQFLHGMQTVLPIMAICLLLRLPNYYNGCDYGAITPAINDSSRSFRRELRVDETTNYPLLIDSVAQYREKLLRRAASACGCVPDSLLMDPTTGQDSLAFVWVQLGRTKQFMDEMNRIIDQQDVEAVEPFIEKYHVPDSARILIERPGGFSLEDRYSVKHYLTQVAAQLELPMHVRVVMPCNPSPNNGVERYQYYIII